MNDIAFSVIIKNDGISDIIFKTIMLKGEAGNSIASIEKTSTVGLVDTYTITLTDGTIGGSFEVKNGTLSTFDDHLDGASENAVQNKVVKSAIDDLDSRVDALEAVTVDTALDDTSTNAVENRAIKDAFDNLTAVDIGYDNSISGITAGNVQNAIDELQSDFNSEIASTNSDLEIQTARIDSIIALPDGSTTADAELVDIRVGADGVAYASAGDAVRGQVSSIKDSFDSITNEVVGTNKANYAELITGYYLNENTGASTANASHVMIHFIPVESNKEYILGLCDKINYFYGSYVINSGTRICFYSGKSENDFLSGFICDTRDENIFTTPSNCKYVGISWNNNNDLLPMLAFGDELPVYENYVKSLLIDMDAVDAYLKSETYTKEEVDNLITPIYKTPYKTAKGNLTDGLRLAIPTAITSIKKNLKLSFVGKINLFDKLVMGLFHAYSGNLHCRIIIDESNVVVANKDNPSIETYEHGLSFEDYIQILIEINYDLTANLTITSGDSSFSHSITWDVITQNTQPFVLSDGSSLTDCVLTWMNGDANNHIYLFGDSYFNYSPSRWMYYVEQYGYIDNLLVNGYGGESSTGALYDIENVITTGNPKFAVWCMGMNDISDVGVTPDSTWVAKTNAFIELCEANGVTPILATIPTTPNVNNEGKNTYIKSLGYRYIDFASAVGADSNGNWYSGMLSNDRLHPTELGAKVLFMQALNDFPEIMLNNCL